MKPIHIIPTPQGLMLIGKSTLLIKKEHVDSLVEIEGVDPTVWGEYFRDEALVNRQSRKIFRSWMRKDIGLLQRIRDYTKAVAGEKTNED